MEELLELKTYIQNEQYEDALFLIGEMEEMSRDDKITKIFSYAEILILHLIKQYASMRKSDPPVHGMRPYGIRPIESITSIKEENQADIIFPQRN